MEGITEIMLAMCIDIGYEMNRVIAWHILITGGAIGLTIPVATPGLVRLSWKYNKQRKFIMENIV